MTLYQSILAFLFLFALPALLLYWGSGWNRRLVELYRREYTEDELRELADSGSSIAREALER